MHSKVKIFICLIALVSIFSTSDTQAFSISPLKYESTIAAGESQNFLMSVENNASSVRSYQLVVVGAKQDQSGHLVFNKNIDIAENWINFKESQIEVKSKEKKDIIFTISVPKNTPPGGHYIGVGVEEKNDYGFSTRLMTVVTFQVAGIANESLRLENFYSIKKYFFDENWRYFLQLKNVGNIDLTMSANAKVLSSNDKMVFSSTVDLGSRLFSGSSRNVNFDLVPKKIVLPGRYQTVLTLHYGLTNQQIVSVLDFWYLPAWFLLSVLMFVILLFLFFIIKKRKHEVVE